MENNIFDFFKEVNVSITISDTEGNVVYMNDKAKSVFSDMVGKNMMACHKQSSQETIKRLINVDFPVLTGPTTPMYISPLVLLAISL